MALTPEDVVNKRFQPTKFREGYDQDEVDDFLDEVVVELRRLNQENEELRQRLIASDARINELQRSGAQSAPTPAFAAAPPAPEPFAAPAPAAPAPGAYAAPQVDANPLDPNNTNNLLQLARRLHEEHVREGVEKRDALIAEGQAQATQITQDAEQTAQARLAEVEQSVQARQAEIDRALQARQAEVEQQSRAQLGALEQERSQLEQERNHLDQERVQLEAKVDELRTFEREYRAKLKSYIEGQLHELDDTASTTSSPVSASIPVDSAPVGAPSYPAPAAPQSAPASYPGFAQN
ncbi:cell wall synthesis protein Wag31 [soil metagenome]